MPRMARIIREMPSQIEVLSFYAETLCCSSLRSSSLVVIQHNHGEDTPFRYNFDQRYPSECHFYCIYSSSPSSPAEPIKDEEFEILVKYQPCLYANSLLAHGTSRGEPWVRYMTTMFSQNVYKNLRTMEIFGNDLYKGNMDDFLRLFTVDHFPALTTIDMSCRRLAKDSL